MNTITTVSQPHVTSPRQRLLRRIAIIGGGILLVIAVLFGALLAWMNYVPSDLDLSTTRHSNQGVYQVSYTPRRGPIVINQIHAWTIHVATPDGQPVTDAVITVDGDMPQHGHGLPTRPQVRVAGGN